MGFFGSSWFTSVLSNQGPAGGQSVNAGPWRPPGWRGPQKYSLTVTLPNQQNQDGLSQAAGSGSSASGAGTLTTYYFDAVLRAENTEDSVITHHPVQNSASVTDHAYNLPSRVVLEVGMSDAMDSFISNQYSGNSSKSVAAYQAFKNIKELHLPCMVATRLNQYSNMVLTRISAPETKETAFSLRCTLVFEELILGTVTSSTTSARPDQTDTNNGFTKNTLSVSPPLQSFQNTDATDGPSWNSNTKP